MDFSKNRLFRWRYNGKFRNYTKIILPAVVSILLFAAVIFGVILPETRHSVIEAKKAKLRDLTQTAWTILDTWEKKEKSGEISREQAQANAARVISAIRYGPDRKDYFWINDMQPKMIMHPYRPELVGKDLSDYKDAKGILLFVEFVKTVREHHSGYVPYHWQWKDDSSIIVPKISFVKRYEPWGWIIGTGVYLEDVQSEMKAMTRRVTIVAVFILLVTAGISGYLAARTIRGEKEREKGGEALRSALERYKTVLEVSPHPIVVYDSKGRADYVNQAFTRVFGWTGEELLGDRIDFVPEENMPETLEALQEVYRRPEGFVTFETRRFTQKGAVLDVHISAAVFHDQQGEPVGMVAHLHDITERKKTIQALQESEEKFRSISANALDGIVMMDPEGKIAFWNEAAERMFMYSKDEVVGQELHSTIVPKEYQDVYRNAFPLFRKTGTGGAVGKIIELTAVKKNGAVFPIELSVSSLQLQDQWYSVGIIRDITDRKKVEKEKDLLENQLRQAQKMEAIGTLAGGIAHDFNNILSAVIGYAELALSDLENSDRVGNHLEQVLTAGNRAKSLVQQILSFSRQDEERKKPVNLSLLIKDGLKLLTATLPSTIRIKERIRETDDYVLADPTQIHQILMNLCTNAAHAMRETGGVLEVGVETVTINGDMPNFKYEMADGNYQSLTVSDTGTGIQDEHLERIFDPFFTTKEKGEGTGMGLSVVHGIVRRHGGAVRVSSEHGKGTVFQVLFPLSEAEKELSLSSVETFSITRGSEHILFVDDEAAIVNMARQALGKYGFRVSGCTSSREALNLFRDHPDQFDMIITDQTMPQMTGFDLATACMELRSEIPVILCSGFSEAVTTEEAKRAGIRAFVMKPVVTAQLVDVIRRVLNGGVEFPSM